MEYDNRNTIILHQSGRTMIWQAGEVTRSVHVFNSNWAILNGSRDTCNGANYMVKNYYKSMSTGTRPSHAPQLMVNITVNTAHMTSGRQSYRHFPSCKHTPTAGNICVSPRFHVTSVGWSFALTYKFDNPYTSEEHFYQYICWNY